MNKKSFNDIEQLIRNAAEANEPAFDEASWKKMELLLDQEKDRKKPLVFWLWLLLPLLIGAAGISYFGLSKQEGSGQTTAQKTDLSTPANTSNYPVINNTNNSQPAQSMTTTNNDQITKTTTGKNENPPSVLPLKQPVNGRADKKQVSGEKQFFKNKISTGTKAKTTVDIQTPGLVSDAGNEQTEIGKTETGQVTKIEETAKQEETMIVKLETGKTTEKEVEKIIDSVITKTLQENKTKNRISRFYIIVAGGAEGSGVKLFAATKITGRAGLALGYRFNKHISVQTGFFLSNKKYVAGKADYKTKPGSYWNIVDIKSIDANCKVYEIPLLVRYDFTPGKKLNLFAAAGLSSYIMKKEDYYFYYDRYGSAHQAETYYTGNKSLFSVLRLSAGAEKKISGQFSVFASPGIAIPLAGVGEGEVKLYSTDITVGLKFTPVRKK